MAELKTKPSRASVSRFLASVPDERTRADCRTLARIMAQATHARPKMWGSSIVGYGRYRYRYASGREGEWFLTGFSPRKRELTVYLMSGFEELGPLLEKLGKHRRGKGCLYLKSLDDVHLPTLRKLIVSSTRRLAKSSV